MQMSCFACLSLRTIFLHGISRSSHRRCSIKILFFKILKNSQENVCAEDSFLNNLVLEHLRTAAFVSVRKK